MANTTSKLQVIYGDWSLGVKGENFHYMFSYTTAGLDSLRADGKEWLYRTPKPTFWRALTDNDRGNQFHLRSGMWLAADVFIKNVGCAVSVDGEELAVAGAPDNNMRGQEEYADIVSLKYHYETITVPSTDVYVTYTVFAGGKIRVDVEYTGRKGLPELPVFGLRFVMPTMAECYRYEGLSGETYPDRKAGGEPGIYEAEGLPVTPYMLPQECGMHMDTKWVEIDRRTELDNRNKEWKKTTLRFEMAEGQEEDSSNAGFAFSCLPYTAEELENATHHEELPPGRRTVLCICGAVRGVGGIDSWGADVEEQYRVSGEEDIRFSFQVRPVEHEGGK